MNTGEKARAYDEMVQRVKELHEAGNALTKKQMEIVLPELAESEDEKIRKWLVDYFAKIGKSWIHRDFTCEQIIAYLEKQKINTEGDFGRGYNCGYEACLHSHGAEWYDNQMKMPNSSELISAWHEVKSILQEKDFRGDEWRLAYNAFMFGFSKGLNTQTKKK